MKYSLVAYFITTVTFAPSAFAVVDGFGQPIVTESQPKAPLSQAEILAGDVANDYDKLADEIFEKERLRLAKAEKEMKGIDDLLPKLKKFLEECRGKHSGDYYSGSSSVTTYISGEAQAHADFEHWSKVRPQLEAEIKAMQEDLAHKKAVLYTDGLEALEKQFGGKQLPKSYGYADIWRASQDLKIEGIENFKDLEQKLDKKFVTFNVSDDARIAYRKLERKASLARGRGATLRGKFGKAGLVLGIAGAAVTMYGAASDAQAQEVKSFDLQPSAAPETERSDVAITSTLDD